MREHCILGYNRIDQTCEYTAGDEYSFLTAGERSYKRGKEEGKNEPCAVRSESAATVWIHGV